MNSTFLTSLTPGILAINGPDAAKFLQGQVTCDVRELASNNILLGAQCNNKGRILLSFRALQTHAEQILLRVDASLIANGLANLGKYIVFSKAKLADASHDYRCLGLAGEQATQLIKSTWDVEFASDSGWAESNQTFILKLSSDRYECWIAPTQFEAIWNSLSAQTVCVEQSYWQLMDIQAGIGGITLDTYEMFTPQALNYQLVNGINFRKGCYTGQEIVARLHYRGTLKRHMYRFEFTLSNASLPLPGAQLINARGKVVGEVVIAAKVSDSIGELLASVSDNDIDDIYLENYPQKLSLLSLPYAIPTANEAE